MFSDIKSPMLVSAAIIIYKSNNKIIKLNALKNLVTIGMTFVTISNIRCSLKTDEDNLNKKETFGTAATYTTNLLITSCAMQGLVSKSEQILNINQEKNTILQIAKTALLPLISNIGGHCFSLVYNNIINIGDKLFQKDETFEEFVNSSKLKVISWLTTSVVVSSASVELFTKIVPVPKQSYKLIASSVLTPIVYLTLLNNDDFNMSGTLSSKMYNDNSD